jgi:RNA polymerase sigma factor (TIGR02999 family)
LKSRGRTRIDAPAAAAMDERTIEPALASDELIAHLYDTLRELAASTLSRSPVARSLAPTALVHEAWLRLFGNQPPSWENRRHFLGVATRAMRELLTERARARRTLRRGGGWVRVELDEGAAAVDSHAPDWVALSEALERLELYDARKSEVIHLRFFAGLTIEETARALDVSTATVERDWEFAKAWLHRELGDGGGAP